jgi:molybdopterin molybdotransferase
MIPLSVDEYLERVLSSVQRLTPRRVALLDAFGCVLAEPVRARFDLPPFISSAMDGFAVRAEDLAFASPEAPVQLRVVGEALMGRPATVAVGRGEAILVPTGGVVPEGADSVVPIEQCGRDGDRLFFYGPVQTGHHLRAAGEDLRAGEIALQAGSPVEPAQLGLLATAGAAEATVIPRARVGIVSTGDELVRPPGSLGPGQIYDSNGPMLAGQVREAGAVAVDLGRSADDAAALLSVLESAAGVDALVCSGGVSAGGYDPVRRAFAFGDEVCCVSVAIKPGRPQAFGFVGGKPFFGLPGNPVAAFVSFEVFVRPALRRMMALDEARPLVDVTLDTCYSNDDCVRFVPSTLSDEGERLVASPCARQSNLLRGLARADALVEVPARTTMQAEVFKARLLAASSDFSQPRLR